jgi:hypothetical protein
MGQRQITGKLHVFHAGFSIVTAVIIADRSLDLPSAANIL